MPDPRPVPGRNPGARSGSPTPAPLSWRLPAYQVALCFLVVCAVAAVNLYTHPAPGVRLITAVVGTVALALGVVGARMFFYVDAEGVVVRYIWREHEVPWSEIDRLDVVAGVRGSDTIRIIRRERGSLDVPPSLLQPVRPVGRPAAAARLRGIVREIEARRG